MRSLPLTSARYRLARQLRQAVRAAGGAAYACDPGGRALRAPGVTLYLDSTYEKSRACPPAALRRLVAAAAGTIVQAEQWRALSYPAARPYLRAVLRETAALAGEATGEFALLDFGEPAAGEPVTRWFARGLALQRDGRLFHATEAQLAGWGVSFAEAFAAALTGLRRISPPAFHQVGPVWHGAWRDGLDSSRVLCPELFQALPLAGPPVVVLPNTSNLLVTGAGEPEAIRTMLAAAEAIVQADSHAQNFAPLTLTTAGWRDFNVAPGSPLHSAVARAHQCAARQAYARQHSRLTDLYAHERVAMNVIAPQWRETRRAGLQSYATWTKGIASLLPEVDVVVFCDPTHSAARTEVGRARWDHVTATVGHLLLPLEMWPPRHFVSGFPTADELAAMTSRFHEEAADT